MGRDGNGRRGPGRVGMPGWIEHWEWRGLGLGERDEEEFRYLLEYVGVGWCVKTNIVRWNRTEHKREKFYGGEIWDWYSEMRVKLKGKKIEWGEYSWVEIFIQLLCVPGKNLKDTDGCEIWNNVVKKENIYIKVF